MFGSLTQKDGFYGWVNVTVIAIFMFTMAFMMYTFSLFLPEWVDEFGWKYEDVSYALTIYMIVLALTTPLVGIFIAKYGSRISIIIGVAVTIIGAFVLANINKLWQLYLGHGAIVAIGLALAGFLAGTTVINNWFSKKRSLGLSITMASMGVAGMMAVPIVTWMIIKVGWRSTYLMITPILFVFGMIVPGLFLRNKPQDLGQVPDGPAASLKPAETDKATPVIPKFRLYRTPVDFAFKEAFQTRTIYLFMTFSVLNWVSMGGIMGHGFSFLYDIGVSQMKAGVFMGVVSGTMVLGQLLVGFLGLKIDVYKLAIFGCVCLIISYVLMVFASASLVIVYTYGTFAGIGMGFNMLSIMNLIPNYFGASHYPRIAGITTPVAQFVGSIGAPLCGYIRDTTGSYFLYWKIAAGLMTIGLICLLFVRPPVHPSLRSAD